MTHVDIKNYRILDLALENKNYVVTIPVRKRLLEDKDNFYFMLQERETEQEITLLSSEKEGNEDYYIFGLSFNFDNLFDEFVNHNIWDLYIVTSKENEIKKRRIKSNYDNIRFLSIVIPGQEKMFYPFTTKRGGLSFRMNSYFLYSKIETITLKKGELSFSGYFNFPPLYKTDLYEVKEANLIVVSNSSDEEIVLPLEFIKRDDLVEKYEGNKKIIDSGVRGKFNFNEYLVDTQQRNYFKFYFEVTLTTRNGETIKLRSTRSRLNHLDVASLKRIESYKGKRYKLLVKPTKKSKYLSLQISRYNLKNEITGLLRKKWVRFRRGKASKKVYKTGFFLLGLLPVKRNTIIFESFHGKQYSDSPRAIYEYLLDKNEKYSLYWSADRRHLKIFEGKNVKVVRRFSLKWLIIMARAEYWVSNSRLPLWIPKPKHTKYVQTWHGTPLKRLAADMDEVHMPGTNTMKYKENFLREASKWDYLISPNAYSTEIFKRAFQFNKTVIESGYPRNDFLINDDSMSTINTIKNNADLPLNKKIILYAPTWRDNQFYSKGKYKFDLRMDLERMKSEFGDEYIIILRLHYLVAENLDLTGYEGFVFDFSYHEDIRELYLIADLLITDYSSVFFDYANLKRPMLFFVYDIEDYRDNLRGFYFDFEEKAPGPLVKNTEEIIKEIKNIDENGFIPSPNTEAFYKKFCYLEDGNASERVVNQVFNK
ncbi:CDP-glycerol:glycerophosphate glycerophosphotransferase [Oceanobacillus picturae]|uniref:CDP-glycerol:glycerophosphate glycerophosphotransferase n=1 Tax=Oceanobacillus picturae TaxID=171693 RepID=A0A0U9H2V2_9BACI|nr:CDP-glycerol glycerophosphotransferase family protein [Oceanobacillus picturae]GAQ16882.1 CDP-glycerol:glycerophosphate glycerophosphotransferase [Oceanobacillus picturae]